MNGNVQEVSAAAAVETGVGAAAFVHLLHMQTTTTTQSVEMCTK